MALKKTIASYLKPDGTWEPQKDIPMHPFEEAEIIAHWAVGESLKNKPIPLSKDEEHEMIVNNQLTFVNQKRAEYQQKHAQWLKNHQPLVDAHRKAADAYEAWTKTHKGD